jgi:uncharacterized protein (DUF2147 family)
VTDFQTAAIGLRFQLRKGLSIRREAGVQPQEEFIMRRLLLSAALLACTSFAAQADIIEGNWLRPDKEATIVRFQACAAGFCAIVQNGKHKGKTAGSMKGTNGVYRGSLTDLTENKTYKGKANVKGDSADMAGCVLGGLICKHEIWKRR